MKALITGATGFVGGPLVRKLVGAGWECRCLVRDPTRAAGLQKIGAELLVGDVTDRGSLRGTVDGADAVFHLAAYGSVSAVSDEERIKMHNVNVNGTRNLLQECVNKPISRLIHFSSTAAFGCTGLKRINEEDPCKPLTAYQRSKLDSEVAVVAFWRRDHVPSVILRPCMIYGPGSRNGQFLKLCRMMKRGVFPRMIGQVFFPMVHVDDVVDGACAALEHGVPGQTYLIAGARPVDVHDLRRWVVDTLGVKAPYIYAPAPALKIAALAVEVFSRLLRRNPPVTLANVRMTLSSRQFCTDKASRELGFVSSVDPEMGVRETVRHLMSKGLL